MRVELCNEDRMWFCIIQLNQNGRFVGDLITPRTAIYYIKTIDSAIEIMMVYHLFNYKAEGDRWGSIIFNYRQGVPNAKRSLKFSGRKGKKAEWIYPGFQTEKFRIK